MQSLAETVRSYLSPIVNMWIINKIDTEERVENSATESTKFSETDSTARKRKSKWKLFGRINIVMNNLSRTF